MEKLLIVLVIDPDKENIPVSLLAHGTSYSKYKVTVLEPEDSLSLSLILSADDNAV